MKKPIIITITGGSGSGKGALAKAVIETLGKDRVSVIPHDMYYFPHEKFPEKLKFEFHGEEMQNFDHPDALETSLLESHIDSLIRGESVQIPYYDFGNNPEGLQKRHPGEMIEPTEFIIVEGIFVLTSEVIAEKANLNIFIDVSDVNLMARRFIRDWGGKEPTRRDMGHEGMWDDMLFYIHYVEKGYERYVKPYRDRADLIVDNNQWIEREEVPQMVQVVTYYLKGKYNL